MHKYFLKLVAALKSMLSRVNSEFKRVDVDKDKFTLIKSLEGFRSRAYTDTTRHVTVGYGFNMDQLSAHSTWTLLGIPVLFEEVYDGRTELPEKYARLLYEYYWDMSVVRAKERSHDLGYFYEQFNDFKRFILADIQYNTGSIENWTRVFDESSDLSVLFEARRKQENIDSRIAKIGYYFGVIDSLDDAHSAGLSGAKYIK